MIKVLDSSHVDGVARLHLDCLKGLLSDLGPMAARAFYAGAARSNCAIGFVYLEENRVSGFILGSPDPRRLRHEALKNNLLPTFLGIFIGIVRKAGTLRFLISSMFESQKDYDPEIAELTYLAVNTKKRSSGVGRVLVEHFNQKLRELGETAYELSVDNDNHAAIRFYDRLGFVEIGRYEEFGIEHRRYRMELS